LNANYDCIDNDARIVKKSQNILWDLFTYKQWKCYISNITINEIYNVVEKTALQEFIDKKIIQFENINIEEWKNYNQFTRRKLRIDYSKTEWFNIKQKDWRSKEEYKEIYKIKVIDEIQNIFDSLPDFICISWFTNNEETVWKFKKTKTKYTELDWNDINHYLLCKEHNINWILSCDNDFKSIEDKEIIIFLI
jgi:predicted nucleic acid-binding protein